MTYGLLTTAVLYGIDPEAYLACVLATIADQLVKGVDEVFTWNFDLGTQMTETQ